MNGFVSTNRENENSIGVVAVPEFAVTTSRFAPAQLQPTGWNQGREWSTYS